MGRLLAYQFLFPIQWGPKTSWDNGVGTSRRAAGVPQNRGTLCLDGLKRSQKETNYLEESVPNFETAFGLNRLELGLIHWDTKENPPIQLAKEVFQPGFHFLTTGQTCSKPLKPRLSGQTVELVPTTKSAGLAAAFRFDPVSAASRDKRTSETGGGPGAWLAPRLGWVPTGR